MLISIIFKEKKVAMTLIALCIVALAIAPRFVPPYAVISLITILMYVTLTLSWTMFSGPTNYVSLATAALFGAGVYTSAVLTGALPLPVIAVIGGLVSFALAFLIGLLTLRLRGIYFILFTFGITALIRNVILWWETHVTLTVGRFVLGTSSDTIYNFMLVIFAITLVFSFLLRHSSLGMALQGIGENEDAAEHMGINVTWTKVLMFAVSAIFMGATGAVVATRWSYIDPGIAFNPLVSFLPVLMAIFGGTSRLGGPILGATIFTLLQEFLITKLPYLYMLLFGLTLIAVILYLPGGLVQLAERWIFRLKIFRLTMTFRVKMWWRELRGEE
jgi:branched-chain amino acid transport system permease protein